MKTMKTMKTMIIGLVAFLVLSPQIFCYSHHATLATVDIDGALVGGASLKPDAFLPIIHYREA